MDFKAAHNHEIHWVKQYLVNFMCLVGIANATVYKTEPIFSLNAPVEYASWEYKFGVKESHGEMFSAIF